MKFPIAGLLAGIVVLAGCGDMKIKVWPFGADGPRVHSREPLNAREYHCAANKRFYLRMLDGGEAAWLILPEREVRLERIGAGSTRYGKGNLVLDLAADKASLNDGASTAYADCKPAATER